MGQNNRNKFASNQVKLKIATSLASGQSVSTSFCSPFHSCLCPPCLAISHTRIATGPSHHKSASLNNKYGYHSTSQSTARKSAANVQNPFRHLVRATPKTTRKLFRGHGRPCRPHPPGPPQRSAAGPQRRGRPEPQNAAPSGLGRLGCDTEAGAAAAAVEKQSVVVIMGCFSGWLGKKCGYRSYR